jgi:hypothetical protein
MEFEVGVGSREPWADRTERNSCVLGVILCVRGTRYLAGYFSFLIRVCAVFFSAGGSWGPGLLKQIDHFRKLLLQSRCCFTHFGSSSRGPGPGAAPRTACGTFSAVQLLFECLLRFADVWALWMCGPEYVRTENPCSDLVKSQGNGKGETTGGLIKLKD